MEHGKMAHPARFSKALSPNHGESLGDIPLLETEHLIALPTIGMIVPYWFLLIPKKHSLNFAQQPCQSWRDAEFAISELTAMVGLQDFVVFEHGASTENSAVGCGVDHAHLHVLFGEKPFISNLWAAMQQELSTSEIHSGVAGVSNLLNGTAPYYFAWKSGKVTMNVPEGKVVSQRLRRVVAAVANRPDEWDYRAHPFVDNLAHTCKIAGKRSMIAA